MSEIATGVNWPAVVAGTVAAFVIAWAWFGPMMFQKVWSEGSHGITPPARPPWLGLSIQFAGTFLMAWIIGITARDDRLAMALLLILAIAVLQTGTSLLSQKRAGAALVDGGYVVLMGALMIAAQAIL